MAQSLMIFNFGADENAAQQARRRLEGWRQGFRLGNKLQFKFDRGSAEGGAEQSAEKGKGKSSEKTEGNGEIRMIVRLDFSNHEKQSFHSWLERIPAEEPFKSAKTEIVRSNDAGFTVASELFASLN